MSSQPKALAVFDFDHTIIDGNCDTHINKLAKNGIPADVQQVRELKGWTEYMGALLRYLRSEGVSSEDIRKTLCEMPLTSGMDKLFKLLSEDRFEVIILSDANTVFIDWLIEHHGLKSVFRRVIANPARIDSDDCITIERYHTNDWCSLSAKNMCKGHILEEYVKERRKEGQTFDSVNYVGDGGNDFCPALRLRKDDRVFPRENFKLQEKINEKTNPMPSVVVPWSCASQIHAVLAQ